jgi:para-nitrobenzyl esterase
MTYDGVPKGDATSGFGGTRTFTTASGPLVGVPDGSVMRIRNVVYAEATRFSPPRRRSTQHQVLGKGRKPTFRPPTIAAPQTPSLMISTLLPKSFDDVIFSEACQVLSITAPIDRRDDERLPVMVWVHGGSATTGAGDLPLHDSSAIVSEQRVIVVSITYRLGLLGALKSTPAGLEPANLGLLDIITALQWVRDHAGDVGGDRSRITLFGQSSGGGAIALLLASDLARDLFSRAIVLSAPLALQPRTSSPLRSWLSKEARLLRADLPVVDILAAQRRLERRALVLGPRGVLPFAPQLDSWPLPDARRARENQGRNAADISLMIGTMKEETRVYFASIPLLGRCGLSTRLGRWLRFCVVRPTTLMVFAWPARKLARSHAQAGGRALRYEIAWPPGGTFLGPSHGADLTLLLGSTAAWKETRFLNEVDEGEHDEAGAAMRQVWADFARDGHVENASLELAKPFMVLRRPPAGRKTLAARVQAWFGGARRSRR